MSCVRNILLIPRAKGMIGEKPTMTIRRSWISAAIGEKAATSAGGRSKPGAPLQLSRLGSITQKIKTLFRIFKRGPRNVDGAP